MVKFQPSSPWHPPFHSSTLKMCPDSGADDGDQGDLRQRLTLAAAMLAEFAELAPTVTF